MNIVDTQDTEKKDKRIQFTLAEKAMITKLAASEGMLLKTFIEKQMLAMGERGESYTSLWNRCEGLTEQLRKLGKKK